MNPEPSRKHFRRMDQASLLQLIYAVPLAASAWANILGCLHDNLHDDLHTHIVGCLITSSDNGVVVVAPPSRQGKVGNFGPAATHVGPGLFRASGPACFDTIEPLTYCAHSN